MRADLIVSLAKMKRTIGGRDPFDEELLRIGAGVGLWLAKNKLHFIGIDEAIVALNRTFRKTFAIVDGIVGMEGTDPFKVDQDAGVLVMGGDLVAVDSTCCRIMASIPKKIEYLRLSADMDMFAPNASSSVVSV